MRILNPDIEISDDSDKVYEDAPKTVYTNSTLFPDNLDNTEAYSLVSLLFKYF